MWRWVGVGCVSKRHKSNSIKSNLWEVSFESLSMYVLFLSPYFYIYLWCLCLWIHHNMSNMLFNYLDLDRFYTPLPHHPKLWCLDILIDQRSIDISLLHHWIPGITSNLNTVAVVMHEHILVYDTFNMKRSSALWLTFFCLQYTEQNKRLVKVYLHE